ncbi:MAG: putative manganese transporter [Lachnospiraceae bacterium]|jgi:hypothetical protein|nr:putative manganese transporter [Lachnospiraceae bacterium]MDD3617372.1 putative manganese transporter [Lachnospiraceae bacterium]
MIQELLAIIEEVLIDALKTLPFLLVTYLILEYLEAKANQKTSQLIQRAGRFGPVAGSVLGALPQCGFSIAAANFYAGRVISLGTLMAVFLSTSDEMLPILIAESVSITVILKIIGIKILVGMCIGLILDFMIRKWWPHRDVSFKIEELCEQEHCHCHKNLLIPALHHTLRTLIFIILISFAVELIIFFIGEDSLSAIVLNVPYLGSFFTSIIGLIPNCSGSIIITQLYLEGAMTAGSMISGLLVSAGMGLLMLFRINKHHLKENLAITGILYFSGVGMGILIDLLRITL